MIFPVEGAEASVGYDKYPKIKAWRDRVEARPAYKRALEKGAPNRLAAFTE